MKKLYVIIIIALVTLPLAAVRADNQTPSPRHGDLDIDVWVDNQDGIYYEGETIIVSFRTTQDCYVAIYSVDTRGDVHLLFPVNRWDDGFVQGGEIYSIPGPYDDFELYVNGPEGIEQIQAIASPSEMAIPDWFDGSPLQCGYEDEREDFIEYVNDRYFSARWGDQTRAFDRSTIYVKVHRYYYKPVYYPHHWYDYPHYSMVYIDYPYGAEIYIDGIFFGIAPLWVPRVIVGWHWFTIYDRYGYCWEQHINVYHDHTIRLDRSRVKTSRTVISRFKEVRQQVKKYARTDYILSDQRVKSTGLSTAKDVSKKYQTTDARTKSGTVQGSKKATDARQDRIVTKNPETAGKTKRIEDDWNRKRPDDSKAQPAGDRQSTTGSGKSSGKYQRDGSSTSPGGAIKRGSGTTGQDPAIKRSGTAGKSSTKGTSRSGSSTKTPEVKKAPSKKSPSSVGKGGSVSKPSGSRKSSSIGRSSTGRSSPGKKSSGRSSSSSRGKRP